MTKKYGSVKIIILVLLIAVLLLIAASICLKYVIPFETQLGWLMDYDEILLCRDGYAVVRSSGSENMISFIGASRKHVLFLPMQLQLSMQAEFDLETGTVENENVSFKNQSPEWSNEYAEHARQLYAFNWYLADSHGQPEYNFYMGISDTEPSYALLGAGVSELQALEIDGLYIFMFLEEFDRS